LVFLHAGFLLVFLPAPPALGEGFVPSVQPSPVDVEHVSTTLDNAKTGTSENPSHLLATVVDLYVLFGLHRGGRFDLIKALHRGVLAFGFPY
jgi:hypothetical protein